jgi:hypothetical protein
MSDLNSILASNAAVNAVNAAPVVEDSFTRKEAMRVELAKLGEVLGEFKPYDSQLPVSEIKGTRVVTCLYKAVKRDGVLVPSEFSNTYVRVPVSHLTEKLVIEQASELAPFVLAYLQGIEDAMIKDGHKSGLTRVYTDGLSIARLIEKLEESSNTGRLNKERIKQWFDAEVAEVLAVKFAAKMGLDENSSEAELSKLDAVLAAYSGKFESLAGGKAFIKEQDCLAMIGVIKTCQLEDDNLGSRFLVRLENMTKKEEDLLLAL